MACGPHLSINTPTIFIPKPHHSYLATNAGSVAVHANEQPDAKLHWGYKTKSQAPLLPNRSRWPPPARATLPSARSRVWDELVIVAIEAQQARDLALSMEHRRGTPRVGVNFPGEWIDYGGRNCSPSIRLPLSPAPTPPIGSPTTSVALTRFTMAEYHLGIQLHGHTDDVRSICVCGKLGSRHHRGTVLWSSGPGTQNWRANMFSPKHS
jgi:hypothetical protein